MLTTSLLAVAAVLLDWLMGEPRRYHPLVGFGQLANLTESYFYGKSQYAENTRRWRGVFALAFLLTPITILTTSLVQLPVAGELLSLLLLTFTLGHRSLHDHATAVAEALTRGDNHSARTLAGRLVSRDTQQIKAIPATAESVLENGNDSTFGTIFWFMVAGAPGSLLYRLSNTLDAMWGYRNPRYHKFGWAAARLDDLLNYIPARLTALSYALLGDTTNALHCWRNQAKAWKSPNAGVVMATGAGALGVQLGGPACYSGNWLNRPQLGQGRHPKTVDIYRSLGLVRGAIGLWLKLFLTIALLTHA
jgi:adenosylcobinamide-phosphate synthase